MARTGITNRGQSTLTLPIPYSGVLAPGQMAVVADDVSTAQGFFVGTSYDNVVVFAVLDVGTPVTSHNNPPTAATPSRGGAMSAAQATQLANLVGGGITGSLTTGKVPRATGAETVADGRIGDTGSGPIDMASAELAHVGDPTAATSAVNRQYLETNVTSMIAPQTVADLEANTIPAIANAVAGTLCKTTDGYNVTDTAVAGTGCWAYKVSAGVWNAVWSGLRVRSVLVPVEASLWFLGTAGCGLVDTAGAFTSWTDMTRTGLVFSALTGALTVTTTQGPRGCHFTGTQYVSTGSTGPAIGHAIAVFASATANWTNGAAGIWTNKTSGGQAVFQGTSGSRALQTSFDVMGFNGASYSAAPTPASITPLIIYEAFFNTAAVGTTSLLDPSSNGGWQIGRQSTSAGREFAGDLVAFGAWSSLQTPGYMKRIRTWLGLYLGITTS